ncbi:MAG: DinB family protein [Pyrinomonadaceae bacterium]
MVKEDVRIRRQMLAHFLAAIAYRTQKALRGAPEGFAAFEAGGGVRSPKELLRHMRSVLGYARTFFAGGEYRPDAKPTFADEITAFHEMLASLRSWVESEAPLSGTTEERLLQGPLADAMTHAGQLAMLRRLYGEPVPSENFILADISPANVSADQPEPVAPDEFWPARPPWDSGE